MRMLVAGATGALGTPLVDELTARRHEVRALTRRPQAYAGSGVPIGGDVLDLGATSRALHGVTVAYYLVHSLTEPDFVERDADAARTFARAAADQGVERIVYLGGLGEDGDQLSDHLRSRREVETLLGSTGVPVSVLRASVVVGPGSISWELIRQLAITLPVLTGRHLTVPTQPIALADVLAELVLLGERPDLIGVHETGGPDVLGYGLLVRRAAKVLTGRALPMVPLPVSAGWLPLITDLDTTTLRHLVDSLRHPTVVHRDSLAAHRDRPRLTYDQAVLAAEAGR